MLERRPLLAAYGAGGRPSNDPASADWTATEARSATSLNLASENAKAARVGTEFALLCRTQRRAVAIGGSRLHPARAVQGRDERGIVTQRKARKPSSSEARELAAQHGKSLGPGSSVGRRSEGAEAMPVSMSARE